MGSMYAGGGANTYIICDLYPFCEKALLGHVRWGDPDPGSRIPTYSTSGVHCKVCPVHCKLCTLHCSEYTEQCKLKHLQFKL